jgi:Carboxypeptidase regulatory-like domain
MAVRTRPFSRAAIASAIAAFAVAGALSYARADDSGSVSGTVVDRYSGAPIAEAKVTVVESAGSNMVRAKTNHIGRYNVIGLSAGQYEAVISKDGFDTSVSKFTVCPGGETVVDIWMFSRGGLGRTQPKPKLFSTSSTIVTNSQWIGMPDLRCF